MFKKGTHIWLRLRTRIRQTEWRDVLTFLFFVALATALWFGHAMQSVRNARVVLPVHYTGIPQDAYFHGKTLPVSLRVEVRDAGKRLRKYQVNPPELTIDLSQQIHETEGEVRISSDVLRSSVTNLLQGTSKLVSVEPEQIICPFTRQHEKTLPVVVEGTFVPASEYQLVGDAVPVPETIKVFGTSEQLAELQSIRTKSVVADGLKDTTIVPMALVVPDGIRLAQDSVAVAVITERFTEKQFRLPIRATEQHEGERLRIFPHEVTAVARVGLSHFSEVTAEDFEVLCPYPRPGDNKLPITVKHHNPYITDLRFFPQEAEFIVER